MRTALYSCFAIAVLAVANPVLGEQELDLAPGQVWNYETRPGERESRVTVLKLEEVEKLGDIVHIRVDGLRIKNPARPSGHGEVIEHLPYSVKALRASLTERSGEASPLPDFESGYQAWKAAFDEGKAGVFTIPVSEAVSFVEQTINSQ